jgi:hypothetical protein
MKNGRRPRLRAQPHGDSDERQRPGKAPVLLVLRETSAAVNLRVASHLWLARACGFRPVLVNWRHVHADRSGTVLDRGVEVTPQLRLRPLVAGTTVAPAVVLHRKILGRRCERLVEQIAERHPDARLSYGAPWKVISRKWTAETCFRGGERAGILVPRPATYLVRKARISRELHEVAGTRPLIFKPSTGSQCRGIWLSTPRSFPSVASRVRRSKWPVYVAQDLMLNGVLYHGRKVDLRLYVLVSSFRPLKLTLYREGVARIAARPFSESAPDEGLAALTGCCYRRRRQQRAENIPVTQLLNQLAAEGHRVEQFWPETEQVIYNAFRCLADYRPMAGVTDLERRFYLGGVDVLLTECDGTLRPLFIETNHVPQLNGWGRAADFALQAVHSAWLKELRAMCSSELTPRNAKDARRLQPKISGKVAGSAQEFCELRIEQPTRGRELR